MTPITITTNLEDNPWSDIDLPVRLPDGTEVIGQTTLRLFNLAASAIAATPIATAEAPR